MIAVDLKRKPIVLKTHTTTYETKALIIATGASPRKLGVPGALELTGRGVSYCATCDGFFFRGKEIMVVGGGDSALQESLFLTKFGSHVTLVHRSDQLRAGPALVEKAQRNEKISFLWNKVVTRITGAGALQQVALQDTRTGETSEARVDGLFVYIGHLPNTALFQGQPGNHEQNAERYYEAFVLPGNERWYTFEWGNARFVSLQIDAIVPFGKQSEQVRWLETTLAATRSPGSSSGSHLPPFDSNTKTDLSGAVRTNLVPLFERYQVDLVLSGHSHNYQRSTVHGITYLVTAGGGAELNPLRTASPELEAGFSGNHFVRFQIDGTSLQARAITIDGDVVGEFTLSSVR